MKIHLTLLIVSSMFFVTGCSATSLEDWCVVCGIIGCQQNGRRELDIQDWKKYCENSDQISAAIGAPELTKDKYEIHDQVYRIEREAIAILGWHWSPDEKDQQSGAATVLALEKHKPLADEIGLKIASDLNVHYKAIKP